MAEPMTEAASDDLLGLPKVDIKPCNMTQEDDKEQERRNLVRLGDLEQYARFRTDYRYALNDTPQRCNTFSVIANWGDKVKCLACNFYFPQLFYFKANKIVEKI